MTQMEDQQNSLQRLLDYYHRTVVLFGGGLLAFGWSRIISLTSSANFQRSLILLAALSCSVLIIQRWLPSTSLRRLHNSLLPGVWIGIYLFYLGLSVWNHSYLKHIVLTGYSGDIFRNAFRTLQAPLYGVAAPISRNGFATMTAIVVIYAAFISRALSKEMHRPVVLCTLFMALHLFGIIGVGLATDAGRLFDFSAIYSGIAESSNLDRFHSLTEIWAQWNERLYELQGRASHYPPGVMFLAMVERRFDLAGLLGFSSIVLTILCVPLTSILCSVLDLNTRTTVLALALQVSSAALLVFPRVDFTPITAFMTLIGMITIALGVRQKAGYAIIGGLTFGLYGLFSFTVAIAGLMLALFLIFAVALRAITLRKAFGLGGYVVIGAMAVWYGLYELTGFNIAECLAQSISNNAASMTTEPFDRISRYVLRSTGNFMAYVAYLGPVTALLGGIGVCTARYKNSLFLAFAMSVLGALLLASFSTLFFLETERIWVFFTPLIAIVAAFGLVEVIGLGRVSGSAAIFPMAVILASCVQALSMTHDTPPAQYVSFDAWQKARELLHP